MLTLVALQYNTKWFTRTRKLLKQINQSCRNRHQNRQKIKKLIGMGTIFQHKLIHTNIYKGLNYFTFTAL
jgi:hypothetical protein